MLPQVEVGGEGFAFEGLNERGLPATSSYTNLMADIPRDLVRYGRLVSIEIAELCPVVRSLLADLLQRNERVIRVRHFIVYIVESAPHHRLLVRVVVELSLRACIVFVNIFQVLSTGIGKLKGRGVIPSAYPISDLHSTYFRCFVHAWALVTQPCQPLLILLVYKRCAMNLTDLLRISLDQGLLYLLRNVLFSLPLRYLLLAKFSAREESSRRLQWIATIDTQTRYLQVRIFQVIGLRLIRLQSLVKLDTLVLMRLLGCSIFVTLFYRSMVFTVELSCDDCTLCEYVLIVTMGDHLLVD